MIPGLTVTAWPNWPDANYEVYEDGVLIYSDRLAGCPKPEKLPELPAEVWSHEPFDADKAWKATMAMCKG